MIFTKKDLRDARSPRERPGTRYYWIKEPVLFKVSCFGQKLMSRYIRWWECKAFYNDERFMNFTVPHPKWYDKWFLEALDKAMQKEGKRKLIQAIYNDFAA